MGVHIWRLVPPAKPGNELDVATIRWLDFWSSKGFGFEVVYEPDDED